MLKGNKHILLFFAIFQIGIYSYANGNNKTIELKGKVVDNQGKPLIGAKIEVADSDQIFYTDFDGEFSIRTINSEKKEIKISYISFEEQNLTLDSEDLTKSDLLFQLFSK